MRQGAPIEYKSLLGGVNSEVSASKIDDDELSMAVNFKPRPPRLVQRGGLRHQLNYLAPNGAEELVLGLAMQFRNGERGLAVLGQVHASWFRLNYALEIPLGILSESEAITPWAVVSWNEALFAARAEDGLKVLQFGPDSVDDAGNVLYASQGMIDAGWAGVICGRPIFSTPGAERPNYLSLGVFVTRYSPGSTFDYYAAL